MLTVGYRKWELLKTSLLDRMIRHKEATVRKAGKSKPELITRPLQKLVPLEISCDRDHDKKVRKVEDLEEKGVMRNKGEKKEVSGEKIEVESEKGRSQLVRAAARDAHWKTQLMLEPLQGSRRGKFGEP